MSIKTFTKPTLTIDLPALAANYRDIEKISQNAAVAGVVKADGYGLGAREVVQTLLSEGCERFFVATPDEGAAARAIAEDAQIAILGGLYQGAEDFYLEHHLIPVINSLEEMARWRDYSQAQNFALPYWLHVDTGMNRLGLDAQEIQYFIDDPEQAAPLHMIGVMSHFACADEADHPMNARQADAFAQIARHFPDAQKSLCNSSGLFRDERWHYDLLRPGYALYGGNPTPETANPMNRVVSLEVPVLQTRLLRKGNTVGYGASHKVSADSSAATIALGYADGFFRAGSNKASVYFKGQACPVLGRVSMDLVTIGTGHLSHQPKPGDMIEILGPHQDIDALARDCADIGYDILTALGRRYDRRYLPHPAKPATSLT